MHHDANTSRNKQQGQNVGVTPAHPVSVWEQPLFSANKNPNSNSIPDNGPWDGHFRHKDNAFAQTLKNQEY